MVEHTPMIFLAVVLFVALGITAYLTLGHWRSSRSHTRQVPPEVATKRWLNREARNARHADEPNRRPY
jgi:uncharacterized membrane protein YedE/YeeE